MRSYVPKDVRLVPPGAQCVFKGIIYDVYHWQQKMFDGTERTFEMLKRPDTVKVIAIKDNKIVVIEDEQPGLPPKITLPGGRHDVETEDELAAAKRELHEETGLEYAHWKLVAAYQPHSKIESIVYTFVATDVVRQGEPHVDSGEKITVKRMDFEEAKKMAHNRLDHYWPNDILLRVNSLDELLALPECQ